MNKKTIILGIAFCLICCLFGIGAGKDSESTEVKDVQVPTEQDIQKALADAERVDDDGLHAKRACDLGVRFANAAILSRAIANENIGVRLHCLTRLREVSREIAIEVLLAALRNDKVWIRQQKIGELRSAQAQFEEKFLELAEELLRQTGLQLDLSEETGREKLTKKLLGRDG